MYFESWSDLVRVIAVGVPAYALLVLLLRVSGKRTLSKLNAFDLVITVAMGSTLSTILLSRDVTLAAGVTALLLLILLQYVITWTSVRSALVRRVIKAEPALVFHAGEFLPAAMRRERVTRDEILAAARDHGAADMAAVAGVVLETDGSLTVVEGTVDGMSSLENVSPK